MKVNYDAKMTTLVKPIELPRAPREPIGSLLQATVIQPVAERALRHQRLQAFKRFSSLAFILSQLDENASRYLRYSLYIVLHSLLNVSATNVVTRDYSFELATTTYVRND